MPIQLSVVDNVNRLQPIRFQNLALNPQDTLENLHGTAKFTPYPDSGHSRDADLRSRARVGHMNLMITCTHFDLMI